MNCEMCGADVDSPITVKVEGIEMKVCRKCAKYGVTIYKAGNGAAVAHDEGGGRVRESERGVEERLKKKGGRSEGARRDIFDKMVYDLAENYGERIRGARESMGLTQEELAKRINERRSVLAKLETGDMRPDEKIAKKLEKILSIDLKEDYEEV